MDGVTSWFTECGAGVSASNELTPIKKVQKLFCMNLKHLKKKICYPLIPTCTTVIYTDVLYWFFELFISCILQTDECNCKLYVILRNKKNWIELQYAFSTKRLNLRFGKEHHILLLQNWFISAQIDFLQICINASLYEWPERQGPVTIWLTIFCHSVKILNPCYKRI